MTAAELAALAAAAFATRAAWKAHGSRRRKALSESYRAYVNRSNPRWQKVRKKTLKRAGGRCEHRGPFGRCNRRYGLQVHHLHYRKFGNEWDDVTTHGESLKVLCTKHHGQAHRDHLFHRAPSYMRG